MSKCQRPKGLACTWDLNASFQSPERAPRCYKGIQLLLRMIRHLIFRVVLAAHSWYSLQPRRQELPRASWNTSRLFALGTLLYEYYRDRLTPPSLPVCVFLSFWRWPLCLPFRSNSALTHFIMDGADPSIFGPGRGFSPKTRLCLVRNASSLHQQPRGCNYCTFGARSVNPEERITPAYLPKFGLERRRDHIRWLTPSAAFDPLLSICHA